MDFSSRAYCKTHHVNRMRNFNPEITRNSGINAGLPKNGPGFLKL